MPESRYTRHALLIGIDEYPNFPDQNQLDGCAHDVQAMESVLKGHFRFPSSNVTTLCNAEATRDGILSAMDRMLCRIEDDEVVVVQYCGHGSQVPDLEGDEADGYDETIVPYDSGRSLDQNLDITDDEIGAWLQCLGNRTPWVTLLFDSCHSGTITRDSFAAKVRRLPRDRRPIYRQAWSPSEASSSLIRSTSDPGYTLFAACREDESAHEMPPSITGGVAHGALSYYLCQELVRGGGDSCRDVFERVAPQIHARFRSQHPQLEGAWDRQIFGIRDITAMRHIQICGRRDDEALLAAGSAHGICVGSRWAAYPRGTRQTEDVFRQATLEVQQVDAVTSRARIHDENMASPVMVGGRAVLVSFPSRDLRAMIGVVGPPGSAAEITKLETMITASPLLTLASDADAEAEVQLRLTTTEGDAALWSAVDRTGAAILAPRRAGHPGTNLDLVEQLERRSRYQAVLALNNPDPNSMLAGSVALELCRLFDNEWISASPAPGEADVVFFDGERLALKVCHHYSRPIYLCILDFGTAGAITQLYPIRGSSEALIAGHTLEIGTRPGDELDLCLPMDSSGVEHIKVFATLEPTDFGHLLQGSIRQGTPSGQLDAFLRAALGLGGEREVRRRNGSDWTTVTRRFVLRERS